MDGRFLEMTVKERMKKIIEDQPEDASYEEIVRELAFAGMVDRGLKDAREGRIVSNEEIGERIRLWRK
jgi:predicted transcriptional regulator